MSVNNSPRGQMNRDRYAELKNILEERRREIMSAVHEKIRDVRTEGANSPTHGVLDAAESSEADIQDDIEFALIPLRGIQPPLSAESTSGVNCLDFLAGRTIA